MANYFPFQQPIDYTLVTGTAVQVVTTAEAKIALRIDSTNTSEDSFIATLISAATTYFEILSGRDLITKTYKTFLDNFPNVTNGYAALAYYPYLTEQCGIVIKKSKMQSITAIEYYVNGVLVTVDSAKYYITEESDEFGAIYLVSGQSWPQDADNRKQAVKITLTAGYGSTASAVPDDYKQIITQMVVYLYENRGDCGGDCSKLPAAMKAMILNRKIVDL